MSEPPQVTAYRARRKGRTTVTVEVIRIDGTHETHQLTNEPHEALDAIRRLIDCTSIDTVRLRSGKVMIVDDHGYDVELVDHGFQEKQGLLMHAWERKPVRARKPVNHEASELYWEVRGRNEHCIVGDVVLVNDDDF